MNTFEELKKYWISEVKENCDPDALLGIVANKNDLYNEMQVTKEEGLKLANEIGGIFQMTSAKSGFGINNLFENLGKKYLNPNFDYQEEEKKAEEQYIKRKEEKLNKKSINKNRGVTLTIKRKEKKKGGCCG